MNKTMDAPGESGQGLPRLGEWLASILLVSAMVFSIWSVSSESGSGKSAFVADWKSPLAQARFYNVAFEVDQTVGALHGQNLVAVAGEPLEMASAAFHLAGRVDDGRYFLYQAENSELNTGPNGEIYFFASIAPGKFMRLAISTPQTPNS